MGLCRGTARSISKHELTDLFDVRGAWRGRDGKDIVAHMPVDEPPMIKEHMDARDAAGIPSEGATAGSLRQVLQGVLSIDVDHEVPIGEVCFRGFRRELPGEEFGQGRALDVVDHLHVEPDAGGLGNERGRRLSGSQRDVVEDGGLAWGTKDGLILRALCDVVQDKVPASSGLSRDFMLLGDWRQRSIVESPWLCLLRWIDSAG